MADNTTNTTSRDTLKRFFRNGRKPDETHFAAIFDSFLHKDDSLPISRIDGLAATLAALRPLTPEEILLLVDSRLDSRVGTFADFLSAYSPA